MAQFDVCAYDGPGLLLDVQADLMGDLNTRMAVPLLPIDQAPPPAKRLNPIFEIGGARYVMATQFMASVRVATFGEKVGSLAHARYVVKPAIDLLFDGV